MSKIIKTRDKKLSRVASLGRYLLEVPRDTELCQHDSCCYKLAAITRITNHGLTTIMPERSGKGQQTDRPWLNVELKRLVQKRQKAFAPVDTLLFKLLRNKVKEKDVGRFIITTKYG